MTRILLFCAGILALGVASWNLPDRSSEFGAADDAIKQQRLADHIADVSKTMCGENGTLRPTDTEGSFVCVTKRGYVTRTKGIL
ncbi:MAG: hypothetical protein WC100_02535 [Sterolibacterium sp.]